MLFFRFVVGVGGGATVVICMKYRGSVFGVSGSCLLTVSGVVVCVYTGGAGLGLCLDFVCWGCSCPSDCTGVCNLYFNRGLA